MHHDSSEFQTSRQAVSQISLALEHAQNLGIVTPIRLPSHIASTSTPAEYFSLAGMHLQELAFLAQATEKKRVLLRGHFKSHTCNYSTILLPPYA